MNARQQLTPASREQSLSQRPPTQQRTSRGDNKENKDREATKDQDNKDTNDNKSQDSKSNKQRLTHVAPRCTRVSFDTDPTYVPGPGHEYKGMDENARHARKCGKCHGPIPDSRNKSAQYCDNTCLQAAKSRRRRNQPIADPISAETALELTARVAGLEETLQRTSSALVRARDSRDKHQARVRSLEAALATERRRTSNVVVEQASKTATLREETTTLQRQLLDVSTGRGEQLRAQDLGTAAMAEPTAGEVPAEAAGIIASLRVRLAEGNAAYAQLLAKNEELRNASNTAGTKDKTAALIERSWDRLCRKLYQSSRGRPITDTERDILSHWITWKNEKHQKTTQQPSRKKAVRK